MDTLRRIKGREGFAPGEAVALSNYVTVEMKRKCADLGARRVFDKSNEIGDLIEFCSRLDGGEEL